MENKYLKYLLIAGVIMVWSLIIWKLVAGLGNQNKPISENLNAKNIDYAIARDSFKLDLDYPDPFIPETDSVEDARLSRQTKSSSGPAPIDSVKLKPDYSFIRYVGLISSNHAKNKIAIINFRGNDIYLKEKQRIEDFKLLKIEKDRLSFSLHGNLIHIKR